jgi:hypothetical protein
MTAVVVPRNPTRGASEEDGWFDSVLGPGGSLDSRLPIVMWVTTMILGVLIFAWILRRPQQEADHPLAAALTLMADDRPIRAHPARDAAAALVARASALALERGGWETDPNANRSTSNRPVSWQSRPALLFDAAPARDAVRRQITYRLVRLSEGPDDFVSREIIRLDRGDEIEIVGQQGSFLQVRTPSGEVGWIPSDSLIS